MVEIFKGRALIPGKIEGTAIVSHEGMNPLASWKEAILRKKKYAFCGDQGNKDLFRKQMDGRIMCLPQVIGSTSGGLVIVTAAHMNIAPAAFLFSKQIDSLAASGVIMSDVWLNRRIITVDRLGDEFLQRVKEGSVISIAEDGTVTIQ